MKKNYLIAILLLFVFIFFSFPSLALIPGDFGSANNGPPDGVVDFEDLMIFALAYGSTPTDANWNLDCDIAGPGSTSPDGVIDFEDLMIFALHYGEEEVADVVINIAAIPGVTAPVTGGVPVTTITATDQYTGTVTWDPADNPFLGEIIYTATITLTVKAGFTLTGVAENFFTVAGATTATNNANQGVVTAGFPETAIVAIGDSYGGGIVAYILQPGEFNGVYDYDANVQHGLIAAAADQITGIPGIQWSNDDYVERGTTSFKIGAGQANTTAIVTILGAGSYAAQLCNDLTEGGYDDWFLPSRDELDKLYTNKVAIGAFADFDCNYWSSSEYDADIAWSHNWYGEQNHDMSKFYDAWVRAVRAF